MRHAKKRLQLNRFTSWHKATLKSLARSILEYQSIKTTRTKAFAAKPLVEKLITLAKDNTLAAKRHAFDILGDHAMVSTLFKELGPRFKNRTGGYTRIINLGNRRGDDAKMVVFELTEIIKKEVRKPKKAAEKKTEKTKEVPLAEEPKPKTETAVAEEKHPESKKAPKKFLGGIRNIFKKERDSL
jgi:large subunit ribosomal protein L17